MSKLYACITTDAVKQRRETLLSIAGKFSHSIRLLEDGILFDVSGLERLIGKPDQVAQNILAELKRHKIPGNVAVANKVDTVTLLARSQKNDGQSKIVADPFQELPLTDLDIEQDTLNVFEDLGLCRVKDLLAIPQKELIGRYGRKFQNTLDIIEQKGRSFLTPNVKENKVSWSFDLDQPVENFEQLIFILNHGFESLFKEVHYCGFSVEHVDLLFKLKNKTKRTYEIKTSFPTLERLFWLKLINLRVALDPPESDIVSVNVVAYFTKARPAQHGLYAVSRPEPESLLLTVNKLKKLVGENNVGLPCLLNRRLDEPFELDADAMPEVTSGNNRVPSTMPTEHLGIIALTYFRPPIPAQIFVNERQLTFIKTRNFIGNILNFSGVWKTNSEWWDKPWRTNEWDIEVENNGVYRLRKTGEEWFLTGEYD